MSEQKLEILAPVGNEEMLRAAVCAGADSVYLGLTGYNARRGAGNFAPDALIRAVSYAHARGVKVNVTLNTLCFDPELPGLEEAVGAIAASGADAVIAQDLAAAALIRRCAPGIPLHGSTQMSVMNLAGAKQLAAMGFSRVILARELTREEIARITAECGIETEIFLHGALCMSVSGQCYLSAFFGGRSGNRGGCAGPCRLPYRLGGQQGYYLSLRDLSLIDRMPEIEKMGVRCVKIEGRLRTPEYVAAATAAARAARDGGSFDPLLLEQAFSRAGFTDGFYTGDYLSKRMFGRRDEQQAEATRAALPKLRELYRRERESVPVALDLTLTEQGAALTAADRAGNRATAATDTPPGAARQEQAALDEGYRRALAKTGGTPFFAEQITLSGTGGRWLPAAEINRLRRQALEELLAERETPRPHPFTPAPLPPAGARGPRRRRLWLRFGSLGQCSDEAAILADRLIFPLSEFEKIPHDWRKKAILALPRALFEDGETARALAAAAAAGFAAFEIPNIGALALANRIAPGSELIGGFGLNITNTLALAEYEKLGLSAAVLSIELPAARLAAFPEGAKIGLIGCGHLPLMLTRACPVRAAGGDCAHCGGQSALTDRKGKKLAVVCSGPGPAGARELLNPVPLWMGDRQRELAAADFELLYFTTESPEQIARLTGLYLAGESYPDGEFTRGRYLQPVE